MNHLREPCVSSVISWQKAVSDRFWGLAFCLMTLACWCTTSWLRSSAHFHTWLTLSPGLWVASLLKALRPSSMGTLVGLIPAELLLQQSQKHQTEIQLWALAASSSGFMWKSWRLHGLLTARLFQGRSFWSCFAFWFICLRFNNFKIHYFFDFFQPFGKLHFTAAFSRLLCTPNSFAGTRKSCLILCDLSEAEHPHLPHTVQLKQVLKPLADCRRLWFKLWSCRCEIYTRILDVPHTDHTQNTSWECKWPFHLHSGVLAFTVTTEPVY